MSTENPSDPAGAQGPGPDEEIEQALAARLQAADPAATAEPDPAVLRAKIDAAVAADSTGAAAAGEAAGGAAGSGGAAAGEVAESGEGTVVPLRRRGNRRSGWLVAAAATGAIALTAGGFLAGSQVAGSQVAAGRTVIPAISLGSASANGAASGVSMNGGQEGVAEMAPSDGTIEPGQGVGDVAGSAGTSASTRAAGYPTFWGGPDRTVFRDGGVGGDPGTAPGYAYDASSAVTEESARKIAGAFGIGGDPRAEYGSWSIGSTDGTGPTLTLSGDGTARFSYYNPEAQLVDCSNVERWYAENGDGAGSSESSVSSESSSDSASGGAAPECATRDVGSAPTGEAAATRIGELLTALGMDPGQFVLTENPVDDGSEAAGKQNWITGERLIGDQRSGDVWSFSFVGDDLAAADGSMASVVAVGDYPVVSAAEAVQRLNDPRFGPANVVYPVDHVWPQGGEPAVAQEGVSAPALPAAGAPVEWQSSEVTLVSARLGVAPHYLANGAVQLMPAYALKDDKGVSWTVIAVADSALEFTDR